MRKLQKNSRTLRDIRIAYTLLLSLALLCAVMGMVAADLSNDLHGERESERSRTLTLCADSLHAWSTAATDDARYDAAVKFENAAARLPAEVDISPLMKLSLNMRTSRAVSTHVRAYEDTFAMLAAVDYTETANASELIGETLAGVATALGLTPTQDPTAESVNAPPPEVVNYTRTVVNESIDKMFGAAAPEPVLADNGDVFRAENANMRMVFSASDGSLTEFVHIHLGSVPAASLTEEEQLSAAHDFFKTAARGGETGIQKIGSVCGFMSAEVSDRSGEYRITVDRYGRVWSFLKVKR